MMYKILTLAFFLVTVVARGQSVFNYASDFPKVLIRTKDSNDSLFYNLLLQRFQKNDTSLTNFEVLSLMIGFTDKPAYKPYQDIDREREIYQLNDDGKYKEGLDLALKFKQDHPLSVKTLFEISYSYSKLNQKDSAQYYLYQGKRLLKAMQFSGDGKSITSPIFALGPADGQFYIRKQLGASIGTMGSGADQSGNFLDILQAQMNEGETVTYYFVIQHATAKMFDRKQLEEELEKAGKKE